MSLGLIALLDDVAMLARMAAASLDDVAAQAGKAGAKAAGVVIDDAAVTPRYAMGFAAEREWPIIRKIAVGSLRNKLLVLLPAALLLSLLAPKLILPLLMLGGLYLAYEGAEKLWEAASGHGHAAVDSTPDDATTPEAREAEMVKGAIQTDFILSAEIMAITLGTVESQPLAMQAVVLGVVGIGITAAVYGVVALLVKIDDLGVVLAGVQRAGGLGAAARGLGRALVKAMPVLLAGLGGIGVAAMIWVGGGILAHGLEEHGVPQIMTLIHGLEAGAARLFPAFAAVLAPVAGALGAGLFGLAAGLALLPLVQIAGRLARGFKRV